MADDTDSLARFIERYPRALVLTGAGISTASGIPDYRDKERNRRGTPPTQGPEFRRHDAVRRRYWARSMVGYPTLSNAAPNAAHVALAALQAKGRVGEVLTQNVDGLHQRAGSSVLELHGNIHRVVCLDCHATFSRTAIQVQLLQANPQFAEVAAQALPDGDAEVEPASLESFQVPWCPHCAGMLKPDVVFFGDGVPAATTAAALDCMERADALLVIGSSLTVFSGYRFCRLAAATGKPVAALNLGKTRADDLLQLKVEASAEQILPLLL